MKAAAFTLMSLAAVFLAAGAAARGTAKPVVGPNDPLTLTVTEHSGGGDVEQQPGVWNTTGCVWDIDERHDASGAGYLAAGATVSDSFCMIADFSFHMTGLSVDAPSPDLVVTISYQPQDVTFTMTRIQLDRRTYRYVGCAVGPRYGNWDELESYDGGFGRKTTITLTVENPTGRVVKNMFAQTETGSYPGINRKGRYCVGGELTGTAQAADGGFWDTGL